jgi:hypothetical protein
VGCCSSGGYLGLGSDSPNWLYLILGVCLGLVPIIGAVLLWVFLVIRAKDEGAAEVMPPMDI